VIGVCGGYQMLGEWLSDPAGVAGDAGEEPGLGLLPITTTFTAPKVVRQVTAQCEGRRWPAYEIHMGRTDRTASCPALQTVWDGGVERPDGARCGQYGGPICMAGSNRQTCAGV